MSITSPFSISKQQKNIAMFDNQMVFCWTSIAQDYSSMHIIGYIVNIMMFNILNNHHNNN
jgi:hypothetical protein